MGKSKFKLCKKDYLLKDFKNIDSYEKYSKETLKDIVENKKKKKREMTIKVNRLQGSIFFFCEKGTKIKPYFPDMKMDLTWKKCGYEIVYDLRGINRDEIQSNPDENKLES